MNRKCEVCGTEDKKFIYCQEFITVGKMHPFNYNIVMCKQCGFLFADNIPSQLDYEKFYKNSNKYTYNKNIPFGLKQIYRDIFGISNTFLLKYYPNLNKKNFKIIDIGCSTGYLLNLFKESGFNNVKGIEPSLSCKTIAKKMHGIDISSCPLSEFTTNDKFDLIIMTGVLEHIRNLNEMLVRITSLLNERGLVMVVVPNVHKFSKNPCAPFDEFSLEHINYFSKISLNNLIGNHNFKNIYSKDIDAKFYDSKIIISFFKNKGKPNKIKRDLHGYFAITRYISASKNRLRDVERKIDYLINSRSKVVIWGVGSLTSRLMATTNLLKINIKFFVDSNKSLQGKQLFNIKIVSPSIFKRLDKEYKVLILSNIYGKEMRNILIDKYNFKGEILQI
jgi:2-polyprenyl-3-methyl-5-hydroxy-6-metoxy-1,4-benzoquinol methylase